MSGAGRRQLPRCCGVHLQQELTLSPVSLPSLPTPRSPSNLTSALQDITAFQLTRGPYALLGHGWLGCSRDYVVPKEINEDYGVPNGLCAETAPSSGVFTRDWSKATFQLDCNTWTPTITMK